MNWLATCPRCGAVSRPHREMVGNPDDRWETTHECTSERCGQRFRVTPGTREKAPGVAT